MKKAAYTNYRLVEYFAEFGTKDFEYYPGMTIDSNDLRYREIIAEFDSEKEAIESLKNFRCTYGKLFNGIGYYEVVERMVEKVDYDEDDEIGEVQSRIAIAKLYDKENDKENY